ncbi:MAG: hypothetical protein IKV44_01780 [Clostridia bacterium]|nr:hypothetical protein [Clostridia bacterium]
MLKSKITFKNKIPYIEIDGKLHTPLAYTTYFDECGEWSDFLKNDYKMFFVNVSFNDLPINNTTGFTPFRTGVFEGDIPDYSEFEDTVHRILNECPDAYIFPRIHISMPRKWIAESPYETVETPKGGRRESLYSDKFKNDGGKLLQSLISHLQTADYSNRIAGYQLCGGTTQEWFHHDLNGSFSPLAIEKFQKWASEKYSISAIPAPDPNDFTKNVLPREISLYYRFCCEEVAATIEHFARICKECINNEQIVGVFYGYNGFVRDPLWGHHGLGQLISSPFIDFFSSPCAYDDTRSLGLDWGDMLPVDSIKLHGKLCFIECDIRTHLTKQMQKSRPDEYPSNIMLLTDNEGNRTIWKGPDTQEHSISALRKAFAHQITKGSGIWWFDMWGGWYHSNDIMSELKAMRSICEAIASNNTEDIPRAEVALFIDEKAYSNASRCSRLTETVSAIRVAMGNTGIPFDTYMVEDANSVIDSYKAVIFTTPLPSENGATAINACRDKKIPCIIPTEQKHFFSTEELRVLLTEMGVHCYNHDNNVIYCSNGYLGIHTKSEGKTRIRLPRKMLITPLLDDCADTQEADEITIDKPKHTTLLFKISL